MRRYDLIGLVTALASFDIKIISSYIQYIVGHCISIYTISCPLRQCILTNSWNCIPFVVEWMAPLVLLEELWVQESSRTPTLLIHTHANAEDLHNSVNALLLLDHYCVRTHSFHPVGSEPFTASFHRNCVLLLLQEAGNGCDLIKNINSEVLLSFSDVASLLTITIFLLDILLLLWTIQL